MRRSALQFCAEIILSAPASSEARRGCYLTLAELVESDDFGRRPHGFRRFFRPGRRDLRGESGYLGRRRRGDLELKPEVDRWIGKGRYRGERDRQPLRPALKTEVNGEGVLADVERPELVLQHDRHLLRKFAEEMGRHPDPGGVRAKRDVEM